VIATVANDNVRVPGGIAYEPNRETTIDVRGDITDINTVAKLPIQSATGGGDDETADGFGPAHRQRRRCRQRRRLPGTVDPWTASNAVRRIEDVANDGRRLRAAPQQYAQINGRPGLFLQIQKASDASEVDASNNVLAALPRPAQAVPRVEFKSSTCNRSSPSSRSISSRARCSKRSC
jgi:multidrug efflux pump subunit AcrB